MVMYVIWRRLCVNDLRKGGLFVLCWAMGRRVRWESISTEMCGHLWIILPLGGISTTCDQDPLMHIQLDRCI